MYMVSSEQTFLQYIKNEFHDIHKQKLRRYIYSVCMNRLNLSRVFVTKLLGVHMDSKLDWNYHIGIVRNKVAKNVCVINRVKHVLTSSALYSLYCTLVMPCLTYCCEVWGNKYKTHIQSLFILQKRAIRICLNTNYKCHTKPLFYQLRSLNVFDIIDLNSLVFMYKAFHNLLPTNSLSYFKKLMTVIIIAQEIIPSISK